MISTTTEQCYVNCVQNKYININDIVLKLRKEEYREKDRGMEGKEKRYRETELGG